MPTPPLSSIRARLESDRTPSLVAQSFLDNARRWGAGDLGVIPGRHLVPIGPLPKLADLDELDPAGEEAIRRTVVIKLNGGLGTGMGLDKAKSLIVAKNGLTFLDILVRQIEFLRRRCRAPLPLLLMDR